MRDFPANAVLFVMQACKAHDDVAFINVGMQVCSRMTDMGHLQTSEKQQTSDTYKHSHNQRQTWLHKTQQNKTRPTRSLKVNKYNSNICMNSKGKGLNPLVTDLYHIHIQIYCYSCLHHSHEINNGQ